jgi:hypothetical protein
MSKNAQSYGEAIVLACLAIIAAGSIFTMASSVKSQTFGTVNNVSDRNFFAATGTADVYVPLTATYLPTDRLRIPGLSNLVIAGSYVPLASGSILYIEIERSIDYGVTWMPYNAVTVGATKADIWTSGLAGSSTGLPYVVPGGSTTLSANATTTFSFDTTLAADYVRLKIKETTSSTAGKVNIQVLSTNH